MVEVELPVIFLAIHYAPVATPLVEGKVQGLLYKNKKNLILVTVKQR